MFIKVINLKKKITEKLQKKIIHIKTHTLLIHQSLYKNNDISLFIIEKKIVLMKGELRFKI